MSNADWWARRLNAPAPPRQAPAPQQPGYQAPQGAPDGIANARAADAAHDFGECPECGSNNYFAMKSEDMRLQRMAAAPRCFDCGYPIRHTTSGMGSARGAGDSSPSKQSGDPRASNYNPGHIIGRLG